jgi:alpha-galactosidase
MVCGTRVSIGWVLILISLAAAGQTGAVLQTSDTELRLEAGTTAPRLLSLTIPGQPKWENRASEGLIPSAEIESKQIPLHWSLNQAASQTGEERVAFIYDSASPHLRLTWEWRVPQVYGPIEHQIRIENLDTQEIWIPLQDSLVFDWHVDPQTPLEHLYVEKGANSPSAIGTHQVALAEGYHWTGTASTYGDLNDNEPREIIPWSLVQRQDAAQTGWYAGIEFSGRTRVALAREKNSLKGALGLNPDPSPFKTRLMPGDVFETPVVFLGGFRGGPDGA